LTAGERIARFAAGFDPAAVPPAALHLARRALLDTVACAIAGSGEGAADRALAYARAQARGGPATVWATGETLPAELAALVNGIMAHVLDYDDCSIPFRGHPSVVLLPALTALAEAEGATGDRLLAAYVAGLEVAARLGRGLGLDLAARGWHPTATLGVLAATAAGGTLLGLDAERIVAALGLAVAQAAGSRENFGSMAKSFQAGQTAAAALRALGLARQGFTAGRHALDGAAGFVALVSPGSTLDGPLAGLGEAPLEALRSGLEVKRFPMCLGSHGAIEAALALRAAHGIVPEAIRHIAALGSAQLFTALIHPHPRTPLEAKFSLHYAVAAALADGGIGLASLTPEMIDRPEIQRLMPRITMAEEAGPPNPLWTRLTVTMEDGRVLSHRATTLKGSPEDPLTDAELAAKARDCLAHAGRGAEGEALAAALLGIDGRGVRGQLRAALRA